MTVGGERMPRVQKKWEIFPGKNTFYCDGRIVMGRQARICSPLIWLDFILIQAGIFYVTLLLVIGTSGLFFAFDCPFLTERISPVIPVVGAVLFIFVLSNLLKTSFSDPGIIPRATNAEAENIEREIEQPNGAGQAYRPPPRTKEIQVIQKVYDKEKFWSFVENFPKRQKLLKHSSLNWPNLVFLYHSLPAILNFRDLLRTVLQKLKCFAQCWTF